MLFRFKKNQTGRSILFLSILSILMVVSSCNSDPEGLGLSVQPEEELLNPITIDTFSIEAKTVLWDSLRTSLTGRTLAGRYIDPVLGAYSAEAYFELRVLRSDLTFADTATLLHTDLTLRIEYMYGATDKPQTFYVYPLLDSLTASRRYFSTDKARYNSEPWATATIIPSASNDRIEFDFDRLGQQLFELSGSDQIASLDNFLQTFKGFAVVPHPNNTAILGFGMTGDVVSSAKMLWQTGPAGIRDSVFFTSQGVHFTGFSINFNFTPLQDLQQTGDVAIPNPTDGSVYLQASAGVRVKLDFPTLDDFFENNPNIVLHRAELQITPQTRATDIPPPNFATLVESDSTNRMLTFSNGDQMLITNSDFGGSGSNSLVFPYNEDINMYNMNITNHILFIQRGQLPNQGIVFSTLSGALSVNSAIIPFNNNEKGIKLRLVYSELN